MAQYDISGKYDPIHLEDFDLLGMVELNDNVGIENLVTPTGDGMYVSRSGLYWTRYTCAGASRFREDIKEALPYVAGKKAFVLLDYMANLSGKVYYEEIKRAVLQDDSSKVEQAKACLLEDIQNVVRLFEGQPLVSSDLTLPESDDYIAERNIECNNLGLLYLYTKCFPVPKDYKILNTGLGGIFIGPFFKAMHDIDWTNMLKSKYVNEKPTDGYSLFEAIVDPALYDNGKILLLDDNIGTGATTREIVTELRIAGFDVLYGAVQYNWRNFFLVGEGKKDIQRFNPFEIDYITQFNYPGHKLIEHANAMLCGNRDLQGNTPSQDYRTPWGQIYRDYKALKHYDIPGLTDLITLQYKGIKNCVASGIKIFEDRGAERVFNPIFKRYSQELMQNIDDYTMTLIQNSASLGKPSQVETQPKKFQSFAKLTNSRRRLSDDDDPKGGPNGSGQSFGG